MGGSQSRSPTSVDQTYARLFELPTKPAKRAPRSPFDRLAKIEVQLILQLLDRTSLLRVAQCNRALLRVVDTPLAWAHCPLQFGMWQRWSDHNLSARLLAHSPHITLAWCCDEPKDDSGFSVTSGPALSELLRVLSLFPHGLTVLDLGACKWDQACEWNHVLAHPALQSVHALRLFDADRRFSVSHLNAESYERISALPKLSELAFNHAPDIAGNAPAMIQSMQDRLTSVQVRHTDASTVLSAILQCPALSHLHLIEPSWNGLDFKSSFLSSPVLLNLERLDLDRWFGPTGSWMMRAHPVPAADFIAVLSAMTRLTHLGLHDVDGCAIIFPCLVHAAALKQLSITSRSEGQSQVYR